MSECVFNMIRNNGDFNISRHPIRYNDVFPLRVRKSAVYLKNRRHSRISGEMPEKAGLNKAIVRKSLATGFQNDSVEDHDLESFYNQDVPAYMMWLQVKKILNFPFMRHIHTIYKCLPGYRIQRAIIEAILRMNMWFCPKRVMLGSCTPQEISLSKAVFASGIGCFDLYKVIGPGYPIYHAEMTRRIPEYVGANMDELIHSGSSKIKSPAEILVWGKKRRFMGVFPVIEVPEKHLAPRSPWVSQDHLARKEICRQILQDATKAVKAEPQKYIYVIDFGGGVGNLSEVLLKKIYSMPEDKAATREMLKKRLRIIVREYSMEQIQGGELRFEKMENKRNGNGYFLKGISGNICFLKNDITLPMESPDQLRTSGKVALETLMAKWPDINLNKSLVIGMCAYVLGAIPSELMEKTAREIRRQCRRFYAVDFSSPTWRTTAFLNDTGELGDAYLVDAEKPHVKIWEAIFGAKKPQYNLKNKDAKVRLSTGSAC